MQPSYFSQEGPMSARSRAAAEASASQALQSMYAPQQPSSTPAATPNANPYASVTPEQGRAMAEINAKAQSQSGQPQPNGQPLEGRDMGGGAAAWAAAQVHLGDVRREALSQLAGIGLGVRLGPGAAGQAAAGEQAGQRRARFQQQAEVMQGLADEGSTAPRYVRQQQPLPGRETQLATALGIGQVSQGM